MPISDNLKLIFVHIPKNAGTSVIKSKVGDFYMIGHDSISQIKNKEPKKWEEYFKFAIVRNPWDRIISNYEYSKMEKSYWHQTSYPNATHVDYHTLKDKTFDECVNMLYQDRSSLRHQGWKPQYIWISDDEKNLLVDKVFYYETLNTDEEFKKLIPDLERLNFSLRKSENYKDYYTEDLVRKVSEIYEYDINLFKFKY